MADRPSRIQRQRTKGWRMPEGAVYVGRPTLFGNPFPVDVYGQAAAVELHRRWLDGNMSPHEQAGLSRSDRWSDWPGVSLTIVRRWVLEQLGELRGDSLACWCPLGQACHADALLERANR